MAKEKPARPRCLLQGPQVGTLNCACTGQAKVYTCFASQNPNGLCSDFTKTDVAEGGIRGLDGKQPPKRWMVFPYRQKDLDAGHPIHDDWILRCADCPFHQPEPQSVIARRQQVAELNRWLRSYEEAKSLADRDALLAKAETT